MSRAISTIVVSGDTREAKIQGKRKGKRSANEGIQKPVDAYFTSSSA
jgi:hypothetical protein